MAFTVDIRGNASHLEKTIGLAKGRLMDLGNAAKFGVTALAGLGAAGAAGMGALVISSSKAAADIEDLSIQFEVLTGSAKTAADLLKTFREEEKKSALSTEDYARAAKMMLGFGVTLEDVVPTLRMVGDLSMGNSERFAGLAKAFSDTTAAGRLMGQEVLQFINAGFNPLQQISQDTGRSMRDLKKDMENGEISIGMVKDAFKSATSEGGRFYQAIEKGSAGTNAKINQTKAAVTQLQVAFGIGFNEGLKDALDATNDFLPQLESKFTEAGQMVGNAITQAVNGNTTQLSAVGGFMGEVVFNGFKAFYLKAFDELIAGTKNAATGALLDPTGVLRLQNNASQAMGRGNVNGFLQQSESASLASYMQTAMEDTSGSNNLKTLQNANIQAQIAQGIKTGITETMSVEVKKGILEAWQRNSQPAKFSN